MIGSTRRRLLVALLFLLPNLLGFLVFTAGPIAFSLYMSLTDWALTKHNQFSSESIRFIGLQNYERLLVGDESEFFWDYFGNTVFLMLGMPLAIAGSLVLAILLSRTGKRASAAVRIRRSAIALVASIIACVGVWLLLSPGSTPAPGSALLGMSSEVGLTDRSLYEVNLLRTRAAILAVGMLGAIVTCGLLIGDIFFRTVFYLPSLLAGVAMFLFWKTLYRPQGGLINASLDPLLEVVQSTVLATPAALWYVLGAVVVLAVVAISLKLVLSGLGRLVHRDTGVPAFVGRLGIVGVILLAGAGAAFVLVQLPDRSLLVSGYEPLERPVIVEISGSLLRDATPAPDPTELKLAVDSLGPGADPAEVERALLNAAPGHAETIASLVRTRRTPVHDGFVSGDGLAPPQWLLSSTWAKTAIVVMGVWMLVGGSNMLLYLAGLSNIPPELYEAADIDGASGFQRFIHVTWPQLAPTTFFIVVMSIIGGVQGGFEQAMVMTEGKADTITLTYYLYNTAFTDRFELGLASAIAWVMFALIFVLTIFNFRMGSQLTNE